LAYAPNRKKEKTRFASGGPLVYFAR
jgi:hypothetical protein